MHSAFIGVAHFLRPSQNVLLLPWSSADLTAQTPALHCVVIGLDDRGPLQARSSYPRNTSRNAQVGTHK